MKHLLIYAENENKPENNNKTICVTTTLRRDLYDKMKVLTALKGGTYAGYLRNLVEKDLSRFDDDFFKKLKEVLRELEK